MNIPNNFKLNNNDCQPFFDKYGYFSKTMIKQNKYNSEINYLLCIINNLKDIADLEYPKIYGVSLKELINNLKVILLAEYTDIYYIKNTNISNNKIILYKNNEFLLKSIYLSYIELLFLSENKIKINKKVFNYIHYIIGSLYGYSEETIRGFYINRYIRLGFYPDNIKQEIDKIYTSLNKKKTINNKQKYFILYNLVKSYDNFENFNKKYELTKLKANKITEEILLSKKFREYAKTKKPLKLKLNIEKSLSKNSEYRKDIEYIKSEIEKFRKELDIFYNKKNK